MTTSKRFWSALTLCALLLAAWGCTQADPTEPADPSAPPSLARASTAVGYSSATDPALLLAYEAEKARVAAEAVLQRPVYDAMIALAGPYSRWANKTSKKGVAECYPNPYAADVQIIGPTGGTLTIGTHTFTVPANALSKFYVITGEDLVDDKAAVQFGPEGLGFAKAALVRLDYSKCAIPASAAKQVVFTDDRWNIKEYEPSEDDVVNKILGGYILHFSQYAVAW